MENRPVFPARARGLPIEIYTHLVSAVPDLNVWVAILGCFQCETSNGHVETRDMVDCL